MKLLGASSVCPSFLVFHEVEQYPPNKWPELLLITTIFSPLRSHKEWNVFAENPSLDPLHANFHLDELEAEGSHPVTTDCWTAVNKLQFSKIFTAENEVCQVIKKNKHTLWGYRCKTWNNWVVVQQLSIWCCWYEFWNWINSKVADKLNEPDVDTVGTLAISMDPRVEIDSKREELNVATMWEFSHGVNFKSEVFNCWKNQSLVCLQLLEWSNPFLFLSLKFEMNCWILWFVNILEIWAAMKNSIFQWHSIVPSVNSLRVVDTNESSTKTTSFWLNILWTFQQFWFPQVQCNMCFFNHSFNFIWQIQMNLVKCQQNANHCHITWFTSSITVCTFLFASSSSFDFDLIYSNPLNISTWQDLAKSTKGTVLCPWWPRWKQSMQTSTSHLLQWISISFLWSLQTTILLPSPTLCFVWSLSVLCELMQNMHHKMQHCIHCTPQLQWIHLDNQIHTSSYCHWESVSIVCKLYSRCFPTRQVVIGFNCSDSYDRRVCSLCSIISSEFTRVSLHLIHMKWPQESFSISLVDPHNWQLVSIFRTVFSIYVVSTLVLFFFRNIACLDKRRTSVTCQNILYFEQLQ